MIMLFTAITFIISISIHEYAHAWMSNKLWDPTPRIQWRLTINPISHIDPLWFILIFLVWFGRWKPVEINPNYYRNPLRGELYVALAWPLSNIVLVCISCIILIIYSKIGWNSQDIIVFRTVFGILNTAMAVFNMLPFPQLDGFRLIKIIAPHFAGRLQYRARSNMFISFWLLYGLSFIIWPYISVFSRALYDAIYWLFQIIAL